MKRGVGAALIGAAVVSTAFAIYEYQSRKGLERDVVALRAKVVALEVALEQAERAADDDETVPASAILSPHATPRSVKESIDPPTRPVASRASEASKRHDDFEVTAELSGVERLVSINDDERTRLREKFEREARGEDGEALQNILGAEKYARYEEARREYREKVRQEMHEAELFTLSRKLGLSAAQEDQVASILSEGREQFFPFEEDPAEMKMPRRERMFRRLEREMERQAFNSERLRSVLSDEQYNSYLEFQANSAVNRTHSGFVEQRKQEQQPAR